jgi:O-antigen biosynthesis protein
MTTNPGKLCIIVLIHDREQMSALCLRSLLLCRFRPLKIIAVDNGSRPVVGRMLERYRVHAQTRGIEVETLRFEHNEGALRTRNCALGRCDGEWTVLLDNDTILRDYQVFEKLTGFLCKHPQVGIVAPKFVYAAEPYRIQSAGGGVTRDGTCFLIGRGAERLAPEFTRTSSVPWVLSACMAMPAALVERLGPLDEAFHPIGFEDVDYCFRARALGYEVVYLAETEIYHVENTTTATVTEWNPAVVARKNKRIFRRKWGFLLGHEPSIDQCVYAFSDQPNVPLFALQDVPTYGRGESTHDNPDLDV